MGGADPAASERRIGWAATAAALVAIAALYVHGQRVQGLPILGALLLPSHWTRRRVPDHPLLLWPLRLGTFALVLLANYDQRMSQVVWFLNLDYFSLFGCLCAAELLVRYWQRPSRDPLGPVLVLSMLVMVAASASFENRYMQYFAVPYAMLLALSFRDFRPRFVRWLGGGAQGGAAAGAPAGSAPPRWRTWAPRWAAMLLALSIGFTTAATLQAWGDRFTRLLFGDHGLMEKILGDGRNSTIGMSNSPKLGRSSNPSPSPTRVLRIEGAGGQGHFRGATFDTYEGGRWTPSIDQRTYHRITPGELNPQAPGRRLHITRLVDDFNLLYAPLSAAGLRLPADSGLQCDHGASRTLQAWGVGMDAYPYEVVVGAGNDHQGPLCGAPDADERAALLKIPEEIDTAVRELARPFASEPDPRRRLLGIVTFLQRNNRYSLEVERVARDPVRDFLLNRRSAHCQYFASAAVMLARLCGIPARYVAGYYAHETAGENVTIVREADAHAWAECWVEGIGWVTLDATPASGRPDQANQPLPWWHRCWEWVQDQAKALWGVLAAAGWKPVVAVAVALLVAVAAARWSWRSWRSLRRARQAEAYAWPSRDLAALAQQFGKLLARRGLACPPQQTWRERLTAARHPDGEALCMFITAYEAARFGAADGGAAIAELRRQLARLEVAGGLATIAPGAKPAPDGESRQEGRGRASERSREAAEVDG